MLHAIIYKCCGALAQLVARHNGIVEAKGSTPLCSIPYPNPIKGFGFFIPARTSHDAARSPEHRHRNNMDDIWALAFLLSQPNADLPGVTTVTGEATGRAMSAE